MNPDNEPARELVDMGKVRDLYRLLAAITETFANVDATICVEASSYAEAVEEFLRLHSVPVPAAAPERQTSWPRSRTYCIRSGPVMAEFAALAKGYAEPEVADHLSVLEGDELVVQASDAGFDRVSVAARYAAALRGALEG